MEWQYAGDIYVHMNIHWVKAAENCALLLFLNFQASIVIVTYQNTMNEIADQYYMNALFVGAIVII